MARSVSPNRRKLKALLLRSGVARFSPLDGRGPFIYNSSHHMPRNVVLVTGRRSVVTTLAIGMVVLAAVSNEYLVARLLSADGRLEASTLFFAIRLNQVALVICSLGLFFRARLVFRAFIVAVAAVNLAAFRTAVMSGAWIKAVSEGALPALRELLADQRYVGYISNDTIDGSYIRTERYNLTQYAVAPVVVEIGPTREFVIGNFTSIDPPRIPDDLVVVWDFGNGVTLLRKTPAR